MKKTYYEKQGDEYVPVLEYDSDLMSSVPYGSHLIVSQPGHSIHRYRIDPELAPLIAAGIFFKSAVEDVIREASKMRPAKTPITLEQKEAWAALSKAFGEELCTLYGSSVNDIVQSGVDAMIKEQEKMMKHPAVKKAYEHFMLVVKLTSDSNKGD